MRDAAARFALVLAAVLLPLGMASSWSAAILSDDDRYVDAVAPLAGDPAVQQAAIDQLTAAALAMFDRTGTEGPCGTTSTGGAPSPGALALLAEAPVRAVVASLVHSDRFATAWTGANRSAHDQLIEVLSGNDRLVEDGCVSIDLGEVLREAVPELSALSGFVAPPGARTPVASIEASDLRTARFSYAVLNPLGFWLPVLWFVAVLAALALGRRRWRVVGVLGAASAVGMVVLMAALAWTRSTLAGSATDTEVARALWDAVSSPIRNAAVLLLVLSVAAAVVGGWRDRRPVRTP